MSRIDLNTLVACFEKRIESLEKNPPDKIPTHVIIKMLESGIEDEIKQAFLISAKKDIRKLIDKEFKLLKDKFIKTTVENILTDSKFRESVEDKVKKSLILQLENR